MGLFDKVLNAGTVFDWISPLAAEVQDIVNGPSYTFLIPERCGWSGRAIAHMLKRHGIKTWGHMIVNNILMITVRQQQADWAQYLLEREGIPIYYGPIQSAPGDDVTNEPPKSGWLSRLLGF